MTEKASVDAFTANSRITRHDVIRTMHRLGVHEGDVLFVHSSVGSLGPVEDSIGTLVSAIRESIGAAGTLVVPVFSNYFLGGAAQVYDSRNTPSRMGVLSERVRTLDGSRLNAHASHPIAAIGPMAEQLQGCRSPSAFSDLSPFRRLIDLDAGILFLGVDFRVCTILHTVEEASRVPYRRWVVLRGTVVDEEGARQIQVPFYRRRLGVVNDFETCCREMEAVGKIQRTSFGSGQAMLVQARDLFQFASQKVETDPYYLARKATWKECVGGLLMQLPAVARLHFRSRSKASSER